VESGPRRPFVLQSLDSKTKRSKHQIKAFRRGQRSQV
jgi:hypothetical protein